ncbi:hypothetical protein G6O69_13640 [Pseudenhygromyxa sp. WMMC2535]|uniref:hypothetical protein n=1 Tax=Pseudenhygromyxa sp. WMMC2535 TaxID=2712867 RepID=UPI001552661F|nr:hypothetical protein [Pseudenhygromyxa sp. WMMC2535]NVB38879.1 hypothetical protein [Pseudenhygromyxa sp. WMMC2535]
MKTHASSLLAAALLSSLAPLACDKSEAELVGRSCEIAGEVAECGGGSVAYCSSFEASSDLEYGPCLEPEEIECEPGEVHSLGPRADEFEQAVCGDYTERCEVWGGEPTWRSDDDCETPLVLNFSDAAMSAASRFELIPAEQTPAATFDISAHEGGCVSTDWPTAATPWLAVDLDQNGFIDAGHELFGSGTRLADGRRASDGFVALASFDANGDGLVDALDPRFGELLLWRDHDADRRSQLGELEPLSAAGVEALPVAGAEEAACDERGNCAAIGGRFEHAGGRGTLIDLFLSCH